MTPARRPSPVNVASSVRARLLNLAKTQGVDFNQVLVRFALERILYRLAQSEHAERFLLKGALLFSVWYDMPHRATRDADLLGFGASDLNTVAETFRDIAAVAVDDGMVFDPASVTVEEIRKEAGYGGVRVIITGELARARCKTQVDVGFGDAVIPAPVDSVYPVLLVGPDGAGNPGHRPAGQCHQGHLRAARHDSARGASGRAVRCVCARPLTTVPVARVLQEERA